MVINGAKGGSSHVATESPDSLHSIASAKVLDLVSEGPIIGLVNGLQSIYLDDTPIQNSDGSVNFTNYSVDSRTGMQDQTYMSGFPSVENEVAVSVPLTSDTPWVHQLQNTQLTAARIRFGVPALQKSDAATGDVNGYRIEYAIDVAVDGGAYAQVLSSAFDGKTTSLYERSERIELPAASTGWLIRVRRITPNAHSSLIADTVNIEAITEVIDRKLRYPMSALIGLSFDAQSFSSVPTRSYDIKGLVIRVPDNYDPDLRTYSGTWQGAFKTGWTDNPAWIFYDLVLNDRYGLGKLVDASMIDKWNLYQIAQYCDVMVSNGKGGQEPRFTCNAVIQSRADAYKVLQDLATVFRGIAYWGPGQVVANADMPQDADYVYTAANVVNGQFQYVGSARKTRYTTALISWNDPANSYQQAVEYVPDEDGMARYGVMKAEITAFGTTSQGQAHRLGLWTLLTSRYETNTVSFQVGLDATLCPPGTVIAVADPAKAGRRTGGRIRVANGRVVTLDKAPTVAAGDSLTVILPTGIAQTRTVQSVSGDAVTVASNFDTLPVAGAIWALQSADLATQLFRIVSVQESDDDGQITYTINATQYEPGKYAAIDNGAAIQVRPITVIPPSVQPPPTNVRVSTYSVVDQGISKTVMVIAWDAASNAVNYIPEWRKDNGDWVAANQTGGLQVEVSGIYQGTYLARVRAQNAMGVTSVPAYGVNTTLTGKTSPPPALVSLTTTTQVFAIQVDWTFTSDGSAGDTAYTELWYSKTNDKSTATRLSLYPYPQSRANLMGLAAGQSFYFWARLIDTTGNIGPWYPTTSQGVLGQSSSDANEILSYLTGQITQTQLAQDLLAPIEAIPGIQTTIQNLQQTVTDTGTKITTETQQRTDADSALSHRMDIISAQYVTPPMAGDPTTYAGATTIYAGVWSESTARAEADLALAQRTDTLTSQINSATGNLTAAIQTEQTTRATADSVMASQITTIVAQANQNTADIQTESTARANGDSANATQITNLQTTVGQQSAAIQTNANSYSDLSGKVSASYTIKTQITSNGRTYIAGIGIGTDNSSGVVESQVLVAASRFAVLDPNGSAVSAPFVIQGGQTFLSQAFIGTGWITNAMIGDTIQSNNFVSGQQGWQINKAGTFEINGTGNGGRNLLNANGQQIYDSANTLRVRLGYIPS